jgi:hypothetical protein
MPAIAPEVSEYLSDSGGAAAVGGAAMGAAVAAATCTTVAGPNVNPVTPVMSMSKLISSSSRACAVCVCTAMKVIVSIFASVTAAESAAAVPSVFYIVDCSHTAIATISSTVGGCSIASRISVD